MDTAHRKRSAIHSLVLAGAGFVALCSLVPIADAMPTLTIGTRAAERGRTTTLDVALSQQIEPYAGVNFTVLLPPGITVEAVTKGSLLATSTVHTQTLPRGQSIAVVAHTGTGTFPSTGNGTLLSLVVRLEPSLALGGHPIAFAAMNPNPLVNSRHALSNASGSASVAHGVAAGVLTAIRGRGSISGSVILPGFGPIEGALVTVVKTGVSVLTDSGGRFVLDLDPDLYTIRITDGERTTERGGILVAELQDVDLGTINVPEPSAISSLAAAALPLSILSRTRRRTRSLNSL